MSVSNKTELRLTLRLGATNQTFMQEKIIFSSSVQVNSDSGPSMGEEKEKRIVNRIAIRAQQPAAKIGGRPIDGWPFVSPQMSSRAFTAYF
ncbi:predicted protein [Sclerotinia sclerotiorum 1980 UF-70]|uniref:Uncharacterized protein n=1 Tax=Sclerotinia sclerotiorum (strain ATCC 18683 / 1980 / Ss-1) TaxID=665079 RepID=A7ECB6_SCLS1|nr:predicted protein [Sclerotinia sclerotiorum 1980 UF-70]EDO00095.1 predicted protein [Sclerotinia sclerotiorum 1980 UF-70]